MNLIKFMDRNISYSGLHYAAIGSPVEAFQIFCRRQPDLFQQEGVLVVLGAHFWVQNVFHSLVQDVLTLCATWLELGF